MTWTTRDEAQWQDPYALARHWADQGFRPLPGERNAASELHEVATMSTLADWLRRWLPIHVHAALVHGASVPAVAAAAGIAPRAVRGVWQEWATGQVDLWHTSNPERRVGLDPTEAAHVGAVLARYDIEEATP